MLKSFLSTIFTALCITCGAETIDRTTVSEFNLQRYLGEWYEIARFDTRFERHLVNVTAEYSLNEDGSIRVLNRGFNTIKGEWGTSEARAHTTSDVGRLRVSFFPMVYTDYNILAVGSDYEWALIGSKSPDYLWILSRSAYMAPERLEEIISLAEGRGYDLTKLNIL